MGTTAAAPTAESGDRRDFSGGRAGECVLESGCPSRSCSPILGYHWVYWWWWCFLRGSRRGSDAGCEGLNRWWAWPLWSPGLSSDATARFTITPSRHSAAPDALEERKIHLTADRGRHCWADPWESRASGTWTTSLSRGVCFESTALTFLFAWLAFYVETKRLTQGEAAILVHSG